MVSFEQEVINEVVKKAMANVDMGSLVERIQRRLPAILEKQIVDWFEDEDNMADYVYTAMENCDVARIIERSVSDAMKRAFPNDKATAPARKKG